jgi:hypothetical protein
MDVLGKIICCNSSLFVKSSHLEHAQLRDACAGPVLSTPEDNPVRRAISCGLNSLTVAHRHYGLPAQAWAAEANWTGRLTVCRGPLRIMGLDVHFGITTSLNTRNMNFNRYGQKATFLSFLPFSVTTVN